MVLWLDFYDVTSHIRTWSCCYSQGTTDTIITLFMQCSSTSWLVALILLHPPTFLFSDCAHGIVGRAPKLISTHSSCPRKMFPSWPCEQGIISFSMACLPKDSDSWTQIFLHSSYLDHPFSIEVPYTDSRPWFLPTLKSQDEISLSGEGCNLPGFYSFNCTLIVIVNLRIESKFQIPLISNQIQAHTGFWFLIQNPWWHKQSCQHQSCLK
jgi:hypothetical protein